MRYQVVVLDEEIGSSCSIESLSWMMHPSSAPTGVFPNFKIYLGHCSSDLLGSNFMNNYVGGSRTLVFESATFTYSGTPDNWIPIDLETAFEFNSDYNLIIEIIWEPVATGSVYTYIWNSGEVRMVWQPDPTSPTGTLSSSLPYLWIDYSAPGELGQSTFGAIKAAF